MLHDIINWLELHEGLAIAIGVASMIVTLGGILITPWIIVRIPADYFVGAQAHPWGWAGRHPLVRIAFIVGKNVVGAVLLLAGILMSLPLVPGPGILTAILGLMLLDMPGKRRCEQWVVSRPPIFRALNALRARAARTPLLHPSTPPSDHAAAPPS